MSPTTLTVPFSILSALSLPSDPSKFSFSRHGGGGFASTAHLRALVPDPSNQGVEQEKHFFIKTLRTAADDTHAMEMFRGEFAGLNAIADAVPEMCPRALAWGQLDEGDGWFLATEFLDLSGGRSLLRRRGKGDDQNSLASRLAKLHLKKAPAPPTQHATAGKDNIANLAEKDAQGIYDGKPQFGFPVPTFCGDSRQPNEFRRSWSDFYANQRLRTILAEAEKRNGPDEEIQNLVERVADGVVPRLLGEGHLGYNKDGKGQAIVPVVVHGDLWSGNTSAGTIVRNQEKADEKATGDVVYDPSVCYAHSEFELGIMQMFGGFGGDFYDAYHHLVPKTEPVEEYSDRILLYELYHHLNHYAIFGGSYRSGAVSIMKKLLKKY